MTIRHLGAGIALGMLVFAALAVTQLIAAGLQAGVLVGLDGVPFQVVEPSPAIVVGGVVVVLAAAATLLLGSLPRATGVASGVVLVALAAWGTSRFSWDYPLVTGERPWWDQLLISGSQSLATYLVIGLLLGGAIRGAAVTSGVRPAPWPRRASRTTR
ncbi:MAG: hypothetical protein ABI566_14140 [Pseudolysinimonas sp.]